MVRVRSFEFVSRSCLPRCIDAWFPSEQCLILSLVLSLSHAQAKQRLLKALEMQAQNAGRFRSLVADLAAILQASTHSAALLRLA